MSKFIIKIVVPWGPSHNNTVGFVSNERRGGREQCGPERSSSLGGSQHFGPLPKYNERAD